MENYNNTPTPTPDYMQNAPQPPQESNAFALTSLILGICSLVFICFGGGIVLGALGIIFAIVSRAPQMNTQAKVGLGLSIGSLSLSLIVLSMLLTEPGRSEFIREFNRAYDEYYYDYEYDYHYDDEYDHFWDDHEIEWDFEDRTNDLNRTNEA